MTEPIAKRADQLVVDDRLMGSCLPAFAVGDANVVFVRVYEMHAEQWVFAAYLPDDGNYDSVTYRADRYVEVYPADPTGLGYSRVDDGEQPQPVAGRTPAHYGVVDAAGLVEIGDPGADRELPCGVDLPHGPHPLESVSGTCPGVVSR